MRFRDLALVVCGCSGCALVDAAGSEQRDLDYRLVNVPGLDATAAMAFVADLDNQAPRDLVVLANGELRAAIARPDGSFAGFDDSIALMIDAIGIGNLDDAAPDEIIAAGYSRLEVYARIPGGTFEKRDLGASTIGGAVVRQITTGDFTFFSPTGRSIVLTYVDLPQVRIIGNATTNPESRTVVVGSVDGSAGEVLAANVKFDNGNPDPDELVVVDGTMLVEAEDVGDDFQSLGRALGAAAVHIAAGDFGSDRSIDLAFAQSEPAAGISIVNGSQSGLVVLGGSRTVIGQGFSVRELLSGKFDNDPFDDLAALVEVAGARELHLFLRRDGETFVDQVVPIDPDHPASFVSSGDLDGDGRDDFVLVPGKEGGVDLLLSR